MLEELKLFNLLPHQIEELIKELSLLLNQQEKSSNVIYEIVKDEKYLVCFPNCSSCNVVMIVKGDLTIIEHDFHRIKNF